jgi:CheY-like chemotaxis protein
MGLRMPVMDGFEAIKIIRSDPNTANIPIIVISPWASAKHKARALAAGANEHLTPPVDAPRLFQKIDSYLK